MTCAGFNVDSDLAGALADLLVELVKDCQYS
jgi:hypothetical protein